MNRFSIALASLAIGLSAFAQGTPNRLFVTSADGMRSTSYCLDRVQDLTFAYVEGEVMANVTVKEVTTTTLSLNVTRTPACVKFKFDILPATLVSQNNDATLASMIDSTVSEFYYEDFSNGVIKMSDANLQPRGEYCVVTVGYDEYNTPVGVSTARFTAPALPVVGSPKVEGVQTSADRTSVTVKFTPNSDVSKYHCVIMEAGQLDYQFTTMGSMFGFASPNEMIASWGGEHVGATEYTWTKLDPATSYEVWIQACDVNGNYADLQSVECATLTQGGTGTAEVYITPGEYVLAEWDGVMRPSQFFSFKPNPQTLRYRFGVYLASVYNEDPKACEEDICSEPPVPNMANWWWFDDFSTDYQINPGVDVVVLACAQNLNKKWGPINRYDYTTPATVDSSRPAENSVRPANPTPLRMLPGSNRILSIERERPLLQHK